VATNKWGSDSTQATVRVKGIYFYEKSIHP